MVALPTKTRGSVAERPWGVTFGSFAVARHSGELGLRAEDGKHYTVLFRDGAIAGATSPLAADSIARIALTTHLASSTQVAVIAKAVAMTDRDEVDVVAELVKLNAAQTALLRRRLLIQRAARTFAIERGEYAFDPSIAPPRDAGAVHAGAAIYFGARMHLTDVRMAEDLRQLGSRFVLRGPDVDAAELGFSDSERPILPALRIGTSLPELDAKHRDIEPRTTQAVIYALVACELCDGIAPKPRATDVQPDEEFIARARTVTFEAPVQRLEPAPAIELPAIAPRAPRATSEPPTAPRSTPPPLPRTRTTTSPPGAARTSSRRSNPYVVRETIASGTALLDRGVDHFALLGVARDAPLDTIRSAYVALACQLHPDKLPAELAASEAAAAQRLFAHINIAFGVLTDFARRANYLASLGDKTPAPSSAPSGDNDRAADEAAKRGLSAIRREDLKQAIAELTRATELAPTKLDHLAALAWARFCAASDKRAIAPELRRVLERAIQNTHRPVAARFYLGRIERMLGRVSEAMHHFREVVEMDPNHADAAAELRLLEPRRVQR